MQVKDDASVTTDDFFYDLFDGGYIEPERLVDEVSAARVRDAMEVIEEFRAALEEAGTIEYS